MNYKKYITFLSFLTLITCCPNKIHTCQMLVEAQTTNKALEHKLYECAKKHLSHFSDLTLLNLKQKTNNIELFRKEMLTILEQASAEEKVAYRDLIKVLKKLNIKNVIQAIQDFKDILDKLPSSTSAIIKASIKDVFIKKALSF